MNDELLTALQTEEGLEVAPGVRVRLRSLADYRQNPENPVSHTPHNLGTVIESIHKVGALRSGAASKGKILAGNLTWDAMNEAGIEGVVEVTTDGRRWVMVNREDLTPEQEKQAAYGDQQGAFLAGWDFDQVLADVETGIDLSGLLTDMELEAILGEALVEAEAGEAPEAQLDKASELQEVWQVQRGQVWEIPSKTIEGQAHRVMCGDSTEESDVAGLLGETLLNLIVTDPPFAITGSATGTEDMSGLGLIAPFFRLWMQLWFRKIPMFGHIYVYCDWRTYSLIDTEGKKHGVVPKNCIVWDKGGGGLGSFYQNCHEFIWFAVSQPARRVKVNPVGQRTITGQTNIWNYTPPTYKSGKDKTAHTANKPLEMFARMIENSSDFGDNVGDPFLGAGTALLACEIKGRVGFGMEIEPKYVSVALQGLADMGLEPKLLP